MNIRHAICTAALVAAVMASAPEMAADRLVLLHTNDTHSQLLPDADGRGGIARRKVLVDSVRAAADHVMLIDAGDAVQGTLFFNLYGGKVEQRAMNALGYDLRILGNHEFDNGVDSLAAVLAEADADFIATNYDLSASPLDDRFDRYAIREFDGHRIGFIGINLRPEGMIAPGNYDGVEYLDAVEAANAAAWWLRNVEGCEAVVAVTHIGYDPEVPPGDLDLAAKTRGIDVIIGGHSHDLVGPGGKPCRVTAADGRPVLVTQAAKGGKYVGEIDLDLDSLGRSEPAYRLLSVTDRLDSRSDGSIESLLAPYRHGIDSLMTRPVARAAVELPRESQALVNFCADMVLDRGRRLAPDIDFAIINKGGIRRGLPRGTVTEGEVITMLPFSNRVQVIDVKGADLLPAFRQMARVDGNGLSSGIEVVYSPKTAEADAEVKSVTIGGRPLDPDSTYRVATIDYVAQGGDYMPTLARHTDVASSPQVLYKDMLDYIARMGRRKINPPSAPRMHR
ncbi:MAG: bifunctional metallophosphatase/5'-nucleotidase [Bacteroides sp.]|nr:bifunctional metallophosphatase/5'-nucleotidase [Bacteroides sp.]MCM1096091.1 bifunctional metallophosphatase/5'-nucleotidase [Terasakiella sp.]